MRCCLRKITEPSTQPVKAPAAGLSLQKRYSGWQVKATQVKAITTEEYGAAAPRPAYSVLGGTGCSKLTTDFMFADWHDAIAEYIKTL